MTIVLAIAIASGGQASTRPGAIRTDEKEYQSQNFRNWWGADISWRFDELPTEGTVPDYRIPYSGHDYPDSAGGTVRVLQKYDLAFHGGRPRATEHERRDVDNGLRSGRRGLFRGRLFARLRSRRMPGWYGHCNGWTAAAIRHAEPQRSVTRNGVVFTPADIKGLLAEIYMYSESEFLGGLDSAINPGTLHVVLANWLGRGAHPVAMETAVGQVVINYPIYAFKSTVTRHSDQRVEVKTRVTYAMNTNREYDRAPRVTRTMYFHYLLDLNAEGQIIAGRHYSDSARIDMLWSPLQPVQGGKEGNERGNPYIDVKAVLAIWRESVSEEVRSQWMNIDPVEEDRLPDAEQGDQVAAASEEEEAANTHRDAEETPASTPAEQTPPEANAEATSQRN